MLMESLTMSGSTRVWPCTARGKRRENEAQSAPNYVTVSWVICSVPKITRRLTLRVQ